MIGCTSMLSIIDNTVSITSVRNTKDGEIYYSAQQCKGDITYQINITEKHALNIASEVTISDGSFTLLVTDKNGETTYEEVLDSDKNFDIPLKETGKYKIKVSSDYFKGSYRFNWMKK